MKSSKHFAIFLGLFTAVNTIFFIAFHKYYTIFLHQTIVYCREVAWTLPFSLFNDIRVIVFMLLSLTVLIAALKFVATIIKISKQKKELLEKVVQDKPLMPLLKKYNLETLVVFVNSPLPFAYCLGLSQPKIYISTKLIKTLSRQEMEVVLLHEKYHIENHDTLILTLATIFESLLPYFPILSDFIYRYRVERELAADSHAINGKKRTRHLSTALTKLLSFNMSSHQIIASAIADIDTLGPRVKSLTGRVYEIQPFSLKNAIISITSVVILSVLIVAPIQALEIHENNYDVMLVCASNQSCDRVCGESEMKIFQSTRK